MNKLFSFLLIPFFIHSCDIDYLNTDTAQTGNQIKIYTGSYGYETAYRIEK